MRILHLVSSPTLTGPADPALGLARAQRRDLGLDAWLACDRLRPGNLLEKAAAAGVPVLEGLELSTKSGPLAALADRRALARLGASFDLVHAHTSHDHALAVLAGLGAKLVRTIHHGRSAERRGLQGAIYARTAGFVLVTEEHRSTLLAAYPRIDPERTAVVAGAVDLERFRPGLDGGALRRAHGIPADVRVFGVVSRIKPGRRHALLLEAFAELRRRSARDVRLVLVGKGEGVPEVEAEVEALGLRAAVHLYGFRDQDLPEAYASLDATVLLAEGNDAGCRAVLESLACGVPVIGARWPAISDALAGEGAGILVARDDRAQLVSALERIAALPDDRLRALGAAARARAEARFGERRRAEEVATLYARARAGRAPR